MLQPLILLVGFLSHAQSTTLYVATNGSDSNDGRSPSAPLQTLHRAASLAQPGDDVQVASGSYFLKTTLVISTPNTTWHTTHMGGAHVSGGAIVPASAWKPVSNSTVLYADVSTLSLTSATRHLFVNGRRVPRATLPGDQLDALFRNATITAEGYTLSGAAPQPSPLRPGVEFVYPQSTSSWTAPRCAVVAATATAITMAQPCWNNLVHKACDQNVKGPPQIVEGVGRSFLEGRPNQWSLSADARTIYYSPPSGFDRGSIDAVVPMLEVLVDVRPGSHGTAFSGFTFQHATWLRPGLADGYVEQQTGMCAIGNDPGNHDCNDIFFWSVKSPGNVRVSNATGVSFVNCAFVGLGGTALDFTYSPHALVDSCAFLDVSGSAVQIGQFQYPHSAHLDTGAVVTNTVIRGAGVEYAGSAGINVGYTQNCTLSQNDVSNLPYVPITVGWGWAREPNTNAGNNTIRGNRCYDYKLELNDGGGIYMLGPQNGSLIERNWVHNQGTASSGALYPDEGSAYSVWRENVVAGIGKSEWLHLWTSSIHDVIVENNFADTNVSLNHGTRCPMINNTIFPPGHPPAEAIRIMNESGVDETNPWQSVTFQ
jgi:hypothetical protein